MDRALRRPGLILTTLLMAVWSAVPLAVPLAAAEAVPRPSRSEGGEPASSAAFAEPTVLDLDPGAKGPHLVERFDYRSAPLPVPELMASVEVRGHVVLPAEVELAPLVLLLHGRHGACFSDPAGRLPLSGRASVAAGDLEAWRCPRGTRPIPSLLGYDYLQEMLASQGYATVSIAANGVNALDGDTPDFGASARGALVRHHLALIARWADDAGLPRWHGRVDTERSVLVGHSRGGEGVAQAAMDTRDGSPWDVAGLVLLAPTAANRLATPRTPSLTVLPYCDGDVIDLTGGQFTDLPRDLDPDDPALHTTVLVQGANHNFFNTEWTPGLAAAPTIDDARRVKHPDCDRTAPGRLSAPQQRATTEAWVAAAVHLFVDGDQDVLPMLSSAGPVTLAATPYASVLTDTVGGGGTTVRPGHEGSPTGGARACVAALRGRTQAFRCGRGVDGFAPRAPHWVYEQFKGAPVPEQLELSWDEPGAVGGMAFEEPLDVTDGRLDLRLIVDPGSRPGSPVHLEIAVTDAVGSRWSTPATLHPLGDGELRTYWAQTVGLDPSTAPTGFDVGSVRSVDISATSDAGRVWLLDAAARPLTPPVVEDAGRLPVLRVAPRTKVIEGDRPTGTATLRWTLDEPSQVDAHAVIVVISYGRRRIETPVPYTIPAGATSGTVEVPYLAGDQPGTTHAALLPFAVDHVVMSRPFASLTILDDD